ncbi:hypothetical protein IG631_00144 [Alternaria alternata]|jgi:hypothetical protein|nr:hypothetical protein IG631_00144 [Alternaria alternata]
MVEVGWLACEPMRSGEGGRAKSTDGNAGTLRERVGIARLHDMARPCCLHASHFGLSGARGDDPEDVGICEPCAIALAKI